ncbi:MAG: dihydroorotase [Cyanobacteria bacterium P01_G01_bin.19]
MELLKQVRFIDPTQGIDRVSDILIVEDRLESIAPIIKEYPAETKIIDREGLIVGTGLIDLYSLIQEPGNESRESLQDLMQAAMAGGFTRVTILPDTDPRIDTVEMVTAIARRASSQSQNSLPRLDFWGAATKDGKLNELAELKSEIVGYSDRFKFGNLDLLRQLLEYVRPWQVPVAIALEQNELTGNGVIREGEASIRYGMSGNPRFSESAIIAAVLEIIAEIPTPVHIMRVSTQRGVELIADAKSRNIPVTASTTWMHLLWNSDAVASYSSNLRLEPPLGNERDRTALISGIQQGIIDTIAIDHQAYTYEEKTVPFGLAPPGVVGLEIALPILWQELVETKELGGIELWQALSTNPCLCLNQKTSEISTDKNTNLIVFDSQKTWTADRASLKSPATNTPYYNQEIKGKVIRIIGC